MSNLHPIRRYLYPRDRSRCVGTICAWCEHAINTIGERISAEPISAACQHTEHLQHGICLTCAGDVFREEEAAIASGTIRASAKG